MASLQRQRVVWTGFPGAPGLSTFYFTDAAAQQANLHTMLEALKGTFPADVTLHIEPGGDVIEDTSGIKTAVWAGSLQPDTVGSAAGAVYAAPAGYLTRWETATIRAGRRMRGRTFWVPCTTNQYQSDGSIDPIALATITAAASTFVGSVTPNLLVWQRPRLAQAAYTDGRGIPHKSVSARFGSSAVVITSSVPDKVVVLRSRRD